MKNLKVNRVVATFMNDKKWSALDGDQKLEYLKAVQSWVDDRASIWDKIFALQSEGKSDQADLLLSML